MTEWGLPLNPFGEDFSVKPDGTPYKFAHASIGFVNDWAVCANEIICSLAGRSGAEVIAYDCQVDVELQVDFIDNCIAVTHPEAIIVHAVNEPMLAPSVDKATAAGIPCFAYDFEIPSENVVSFAYHDFDGEFGSNLVGEYFIERAEAENKELIIYEIWGLRSMLSMTDRHEGFHRAVDQCPLITVVESGGEAYSDPLTAEVVEAAFPAHPELNAIFHQTGGVGGCISGLRSIGRLFTVDNPDHVLIAINDTDTRVVEGMRDGFIDAFGSHGSWDLGDVTVKSMLNYVVLGEPVPPVVAIPMFVLTTENIDTLRVFGGVPAVYPLMPEGQWDLWPVMDTSEIGIPTPTKALRMELKGY